MNTLATIHLLGRAGLLLMAVGAAGLAAGWVHDLVRTRRHRRQIEGEMLAQAGFQAVGRLGWCKEIK